jgi:hypothetical protein
LKVLEPCNPPSSNRITYITYHPYIPYLTALQHFFLLESLKSLLLILLLLYDTQPKPAFIHPTYLTMAKDFLQKLNIQDDEIQSKKRVVNEIIKHGQEIGVLKEQNRALQEENAHLKAAQKKTADVIQT